MPRPTIRSAPAGACLLAALACGHAAATDQQHGVNPTGVNVVPLRSVFHDDVRVLWLGDSFALPTISRMAASSLLAWRVDEWTAFVLGDGPTRLHVAFTEFDDSIATVDAENNYALFGTGPDANENYALPLWKLREYRRDDADVGPAPLVAYSSRDSAIAAGYLQAFAEAGETVRARQLLLDPPGDPVSITGVRLSTDAPAGAIDFNPRAESRPKRLAGLDPESDAPSPPADGQVFASPADLKLVADATGRVEYTLTDNSADGDAGYLFPAGLVAYKTDAGQRRPGMYFGVLADTSWRYSGFGLDTPSGTPGVSNKTFSREQLAHWLDATTIDPDQPLFVFSIVDVEDITPAEAAERMEAMVDQTAAAAADAGIGSVHHCFVIPWQHRINGEIIPDRHIEQRDAAFALAASRPDVSAVSIFDFTDRQTFDGNPDSIQWLTDNGYDSFSYGGVTRDLANDGPGANGGLLDVFRAHPQGRDSGAFFAHVIERIITDGCPADVAAPYGVLDLADIAGFVTGFLNQRPSSDTADPRGVWDLTDLLTYITAFNDGCSD